MVLLPKIPTKRVQLTVNEPQPAELEAMAGDSLGASISKRVQRSHSELNVRFTASTVSVAGIYTSSIVGGIRSGSIMGSSSSMGSIERRSSAQAVKRNSGTMMKRGSNGAVKRGSGMAASKRGSALVFGVGDAEDIDDLVGGMLTRRTANGKFRSSEVDDYLLRMLRRPTKGFARSAAAHSYMVRMLEHPILQSTPVSEMEDIGSLDKEVESPLKPSTSEDGPSILMGGSRHLASMLVPITPQAALRPKELTDM
jgi:hypothetical protein